MVAMRCQPWRAWVKISNHAINEEDIDFNIPGVPHSAVKQLHGVSVRDLKQKIENHPNRHAFQRNLQQSQSFNPFNQESKEMIHEVGNVVLCELLDMEPKTQCKVYLSYWDVGIVHCTCGHFYMDLLSIPTSTSSRTNWRTKDHTQHITAEEIGVHSQQLVAPFEHSPIRCQSDVELT